MTRTLILTLALAHLLASPASAEGPRNLLFGGLDTTIDPQALAVEDAVSGYGGLGWVFAPRGLDAAGPAVSVEIGRSVREDRRLAALAGWRWRPGRVYLSAMIGVERGAEGSRPIAAADLWWDDRGWMAAARVQGTRDYASWRLAAGRRLPDRDAAAPRRALARLGGALTGGGFLAGAFLGPELAQTGDDARRVGLHATGIRLPLGAEARVSAGAVIGDDPRRGYAELSLWRRF